MSKLLRTACLLLACLLAGGVLTACDVSDVLDALDDLNFEPELGEETGAEANPETEEKTRPVATPADTEGDDRLDPDTTQAGDPFGEETDLPSAEQIALDTLGKVNWGGEDFTVLCGMSTRSEMYADTVGSGTVSDAVYERNLLLEELCNLKWRTVEAATDESVTDMIRNEAAAAAGDFQLIDHSARYAVSNASSGYLNSFRNLGREDLSGPWWDQGTAELILGGQVYFMAGSANTLDDDATCVLYFNKELGKEWGIEDPYKIVLDGTWTLDYFGSMVHNTAVENGDGKWDEKDTHGFVSYYGYANAFFISSDLRYTRYMAEDEEIYVLVSNDLERMVVAADRIRSIYTAEQGGYIAPAGEYDKALAIFKGGNSLFYGDALGCRPDTEEAYAILPLPKFDLDQAEYRSWAHISASALSVPTTLGTGDRAETVGLILEAFAILSHGTVRPAYCESVLRERREQDSAAFDMLDIVQDNRVWELAFLLDNSSCTDAFEIGVRDGTVASQSRRIQATLNKLIQQLSKSFDKLYS